MDNPPINLPLDLAAVKADDALLDAAGNPHPTAEDPDALAQMLAAWRREIDSEPVTRIMDTDTVLSVVARARGLPRRQGLLARLRAWLRNSW